MESNYGSSESNYGYGGYSGRNYGGFSSESSYSSESRDSYRPISSSFSSESSLSSESRDTFRPTPSFSSESALESSPSSYSSESRDISTPTYSTPSKPQNSKKYNSLDDIDKLIERLESSMQSANLTSDRANQVLAQRKQKIDELKKLVADARKSEVEERMIKQLEQENSELDNAIDILNKGFHR